MTIQEKILLKLSDAKKIELIKSEIEESNYILSKENKVISNYTLNTLSVAEIIPSQVEDDYQNDSSKYDAKVFLDARSGIANLEDLRLERFRPISVDRRTMVIIDGNHRHCALKLIKEELVYVLLCEINVLNK